MKSEKKKLHFMLVEEIGKDLGTCAFKISRTADANEYVMSMRDSASVCCAALPNHCLKVIHHRAAQTGWKSPSLLGTSDRGETPQGIQGRIQEFRHRGVGREDE